MKASRPAPKAVDDPSVRWAAESTLLAWVRTALSLIGLGFVVARFVTTIDILGSGFLHPTRDLAEMASAVLGVAFMFLGASAMAFAAQRYRRYRIDTTTAGRLPRGAAVSFVTAVVVSVLGTLLALSLVVGSA